MTVSNGRSVVVLNDLSRLCKDSERGFRVAAESVDNRGLKMLFKTYAQQRAQFAAELAQEVERLGGQPRFERGRGGSFLAVLHRGWIDIRAAMTIGQQNTENFVLSEALRGENAAVQQYEKSLKNDLPAVITTVVERQYARVKEVRDQVMRMGERARTRLVVRLFDSAEDMERAQAALQTAGFNQEGMKTVAMDEVISVYQDDQTGSATMESGVTGAFMGSIIGGLIGLIAGVSILLTPGNSATMMEGLGTFASLAIVGALAGALFGALIGSLIGRGMKEEDEFLYDDSVRYGRVLLMVQSENKRAAEAAHIMHQVNASRVHVWQERPEAQQGSTA
jgi:uncharacterized protein (TIGR02284 family)